MFKAIGRIKGYLYFWLNDGNDVWCCRSGKKASESDIFPSRDSNIAFKWTKCFKINKNDYKSLQSIEIDNKSKYAAIIVQDRKYPYSNLRVINMRTGIDFIKLNYIGKGSIISSDNSCIYYAKTDESSGAISEIRKQSLTSIKENRCVASFDSTAWPTVHATDDRKYLLVYHGSQVTIIRLASNNAAEKVIDACNGIGSVHKIMHKTIESREFFFGYFVDKFNNWFLIIINGEDSIKKTDTWLRKQIKVDEIEDLFLLENKIVLQVKFDQKIQIRFLDIKALVFNHNQEWKNITIQMKKHMSLLKFVRPIEVNKQSVPYSIECPACRPSIHYLNFSKEESSIDYSSSGNLNHVTQQYNILSRDGETEIPVTIISPIRNPQNKIVLAVYGSYGIKFNYNYSPLIQSLIDNGIYFAYAHVRGGGEKGEKWHQAGMGINTINSIHDYLDVANGINRLVHRTKCKVIGMGASAGGFVVASALNENPLSFAGIYISAPFISPLTAIKDVKNPRWRMDMLEFGNPDNKRDVQILRHLSPLENIKGKHYPPALVALNEFDVNVNNYQIREYIDKLRKTGASVDLLLRIGASHSVFKASNHENDEIRWIKRI
ncbi:prolyl oligopeptidase family serine peptidase [Bifidobacterium longum subsp. infantis]|uniref:Prolyl oligopeptidase family serine peptidase n=1 Tax=Bifidobacterium longum subsp. infantis TaxID=1682 RepID=A0A7D4XWX0_BIFLI|nr:MULTISPECIES: prolyl oligopeptidase family serine peptidase [Bifidobacterium]KAB1942870.1 prolyl oligopeptidase family serine peptidase [Bifidobacterium longum subsp. infantis]MED7620829.1 hypothetical protein [Bifidobacterium longum subsp. infantis]NQX51905.1 prolyl oligopeptidase family serine peptidase [Bifidobacterium longum subsp. infantis]QKY12826.1 prolyl oligopeptidase family serine peptidase [Bifidobacterium longum subsp. infantis]UPT02945.1 prolyl oligopeptidase family serine pept